MRFPLCRLGSLRHVTGLRLSLSRRPNEKHPRCTIRCGGTNEAGSGVTTSLALSSVKFLDRHCILGPDKDTVNFHHKYIIILFLFIILQTVHVFILRVLLHVRSILLTGRPPRLYTTLGTLVPAALLDLERPAPMSEHDTRFFP
ncbi:hypothetical protein PsorP6_015392 [Peronosclerospora sorghi]|uniref:Uncharacterized protein n=1 Tax=Peronosclerospora sorghi TaxID=230839 RepID=A0ACC0WPA3_9STRA|nr:hypothetical protein PsorP6_015392 [Peronosclerospora sorghi]